MFDIRGSKSIALVIAIIIFSAGLSTCRSSPTFSGDIQNLDSLKESLQSAGARVQDGKDAPANSFDVGGNVLIVDQEEVEVYEFSNNREREAIAGTISAEGIIVGGNLIPWEGRPTAWGSGPLIVLYRGYDGGIILLLSGLLGDPLTYENPVEDEPFPPTIVAAIRYLADDLQIDPGLIQVTEFIETEWPDSCLGVPRAEENCLPTPISGWRVLMKIRGDVYEVRVDESGDQFQRP